MYWIDGIGHEGDLTEYLLYCISNGIPIGVQDFSSPGWYIKQLAIEALEVDYDSDC